MSATAPPAKRPSAPTPPVTHPPRRLDTCVVPFLLAEPTSAVQSVFDALKLVLRQKNDPRSSLFKPTSRAPPPPMENTHVFVQEKYDGHRQHVSIASDGSVSVHGKETAELETVADSFLEILRAELAHLPRPCLNDAEIVSWNAGGHVTLDLVKPARGGRPWRSFELIHSTPYRAPCGSQTAAPPRRPPPPASTAPHAPAGTMRMTVGGFRRLSQASCRWPSAGVSGAAAGAALRVPACGL